MKKINYFEILQLTSGNYLSENIPDNWMQMSDDEQSVFLEENAWEPFEYWEVDEVWSLIDAAAYSTKILLERMGIEVTDAK